MRLMLLLLIVGVCLVSAKYLPYDTDNFKQLLSRHRRSDSEDSLDESNSNATEDVSDEESDEQSKLNVRIEKMRQKLLEKQEKEKRKQEEAQRKLEEKIARELKKEEEKRLKEEEKRQKEERKREERLEKERKKLEEEQRKLEEKVLKNEQKRQKILQKKSEELEEDTLKLQWDDSNSSESDTDDSTELEDFWKEYIYSKYGLNDSNTDLEKETALKRYMQEELGLNINSTTTERRQAVLRLVENKLQTVSDQYILQSQLIDFVNSVGAQKIRAQLEKEIEELNNKTDTLSNVDLPWVPLAKESFAEQVFFLQTIKEFLLNILPNLFNEKVSTNKPNINGASTSNDNKPSTLDSFNSVHNENISQEIKSTQSSSNKNNLIETIPSAIPNFSDISNNAISSSNIGSKVVPVSTVAIGAELTSNHTDEDLSSASASTPPTKVTGAKNEADTSVSIVPNNSLVDSVQNIDNLTDLINNVVGSDFEQRIGSDVSTTGLADGSYSKTKLDNNDITSNTPNLESLNSIKIFSLNSLPTNDPQIVLSTVINDAIDLQSALNNENNISIKPDVGASANQDFSSKTESVSDSAMSKTNILPNTRAGANTSTSSDNNDLAVDSKSETTNDTIKPINDLSGNKIQSPTITSVRTDIKSEVNSDSISSNTMYGKTDSIQALSDPVPVGDSSSNINNIAPAPMNGDLNTASTGLVDRIIGLSNGKDVLPSTAATNDFSIMVTKILSSAITTEVPVAILAADSTKQQRNEITGVSTDQAILSNPTSSYVSSNNADILSSTTVSSGLNNTSIISTGTDVVNEVRSGDISTYSVNVVDSSTDRVVTLSSSPTNYPPIDLLTSLLPKDNRLDSISSTTSDSSNTRKNEISVTDTTIINLPESSTKIISTNTEPAPSLVDIVVMDKNAGNINGITPGSINLIDTSNDNIASLNITFPNLLKPAENVTILYSSQPDNATSNVDILPITIENNSASFGETVFSAVTQLPVFQTETLTTIMSGKINTSLPIFDQSSVVVSDIQQFSDINTTRDQFLENAVTLLSTEQTVVTEIVPEKVLPTDIAIPLEQGALVIDIAKQ